MVVIYSQQSLGKGSKLQNDISYSYPHPNPHPLSTQESARDFNRILI